MKKILITIVSFLLMVGFASAADVTLRWDANTETELGGYKLYRTTTPGNYGWTPTGNNTGLSIVGQGTLVGIIPADLEADPPVNPTEYTDTNIPEGAHYYYVLTAFSKTIDGIITPSEITGTYSESLFSNEVDDIIPYLTPSPPQNLTWWETILAWIKSIFTWFA